MRRESAAKDRFALGPGRIDAWFVPLDAFPGEAAALGPALLSAEEQARASRFHAESDRRNYIRSHLALRLLLARYLGADPAALVFAGERGARPTLVARPSGFSFNLSHAGEAALVAVAGEADVGVDLEWMRELPDLAEIASLHFAPPERRAWLRLPPRRRLRGFYRTWTRKEAFVKALGLGLSFPLDAFCTGDPDGPPALMNGQGEPLGDWSLTDLTLPEGYVGALAAKRRGAAVRCEVADWRWMRHAAGPAAVF